MHAFEIVFIVVTLPIIIGAILKHYFPQIENVEKILNKVCLLVFIVIMKLAIYLSIINIQNPSQIFIAVFVFMVILITLVFVVLKLSSHSFKITKTDYKILCFIGTGIYLIKK